MKIIADKRVGLKPTAEHCDLAIPSGEIGEYIIKLCTVLEETHTSLKSLENSISTILADETAEKDVDCPKDFPAKSSLGGRLAATVSVAVLLNDRINRLTSRVVL